MIFKWLAVSLEFYCYGKQQSRVIFRLIYAKFKVQSTEIIEENGALHLYANISIVFYKDFAALPLKKLPGKTKDSTSEGMNRNRFILTCSDNNDWDRPIWPFLLPHNRHKFFDLYQHLPIFPMHD
jgi:hypothetical protein